MGKALQTRHEQMPETLDCRADHQGRVESRGSNVCVCLICVHVMGVQRGALECHLTVH